MPLTENQKQSRYNYAKKALKRIPLDVQKDKYEEIKAAANNAGEPVNGYIKKAIDERMERDSKALSPTAAPSATRHPPIPDRPALSSTAASGNASLKPYKPFTKEAAEQIDTGKLLHDFQYQLDIAAVFGNDVLSNLLSEARGNNPGQSSSSIERTPDSATAALPGSEPDAKLVPSVNETLGEKLNRLRKDHLSQEISN